MSSQENNTVKVLDVITFSDCGSQESVEAIESKLLSLNAMYEMAVEKHCNAENIELEWQGDVPIDYKGRNLWYVTKYGYEYDCGIFLELEDGKEPLPGTVPQFSSLSSKLFTP